MLHALRLVGADGVLNKCIHPLLVTCSRKDTARYHKTLAYHQFGALHHKVHKTLDTM